MAAIKAFKNENAELMNYLLNNGVDINQKDEDGNTLLLLAAKDNYNAKMLRYLINKGANVNSENNQLKSSLFYALYNGNYENSKLLLENKAYPEENMLSMFVSENYIKFVKLLLEHNFDIFEETNGLLPLDYAKTTEMKKLLFPYYDRELKLLERRESKLLNLSGPNMFYFYPDIMGRKILLLGERHEMKSLCIDKDYSHNMAEWLYELIKNSSECIDLIVETNYRLGHNKDRFFDKSEGKFNLHINAVRAKFEECEISKNCNNLRYHYVDVRNFDKSTSLFSKVLMKFSKDIKSKFGNYSSENALKIYYYLLGFRETENEELFYEYSKDLAKTYDIDYDEKEHRKYITNLHSILNKEISKLDKKIDKEKFFQDIIQAEMDNRDGDELILILSLLAMDAYTLIRLFINFPSDKIRRGPKGCQLNYMKNIIIYAGDHHIKVYRDFFKLYFGVDFTIGINYDIYGKQYQCIQLEKPFKFI